MVELTGEPRVRGAFAAVLEERRDRFNAAFAQARHDNPRLDAHAFSDHLSLRVAPIVNAVAEVFPEQVIDTGAAVYDLSLEMLRADLLNRPEIALIFTDLLPKLVHPLAREPRRVVAAVVNAALQIGTRGASPMKRWISAVGAAAQLDPSLDYLLGFGQVAAWRAGLAHYREGALKVAPSLDPSLVALAVDASAADAAQCLARLPSDSAARTAHVAQMLERLTVDRWHAPGSPQQPEARTMIRARIGAFRGFGGVFQRPPTVSTSENRLFATDGSDTWQISVDAFGSTFHRVGPMPAWPGMGAFTLDRDGTVWRGRERQRIEVLADARSWASTDDTLAVTLSSTHHVFVIGHTRG